MKYSKGIFTRRQKKQLLRLSTLLGLAFLIFCGVFSMQQRRELENRQLTTEELSSFMSFYEYNKPQWMGYFEEKGYGKKISGRELTEFCHTLGVTDYMDLETISKGEIVPYDEFLPVYEQLLTLLDTDHQVNLKEMKLDGKQCQVYCVEDKIIGFKSYVKKSLISKVIAKESTHTDKENITVLLKNGVSFYRKSCYLKVNSAYTRISEKQKEKTVKKDGLLSFTKTGKVSSPKKKECVTLVPKTKTGRIYLADRNGNVISKGYRGTLKVYRYTSGYVLINELPVGQYLYGVIPSEMPSSYDEEALKAQAVCARSYVYRHMDQSNNLKKFYAQIDDSTTYQVYNKSAESSRTNKAVDDTKNVVLKYKGKIATTYYYSTSCGMRQGYEIWSMDKTNAGYLQAGMIHKTKTKAKNLSKEKAFKEFMEMDEKGFYEKDYPYFRWTVKISYKDKEDALNKAILARKKASVSSVTCLNEKGKEITDLSGLGSLKSIKVTGRYECGAIEEVTLTYQKGKVKLKNEYTIRLCLAALKPEITLKDGTKLSSQMLPSACFYIKSQKKKNLELRGGGFGHGLGMSQNGANELAKSGYDYKKILNFFYQEVTF